MYIPDTIFDINKMEQMNNLINNPSEVQTLIIFISYVILLSTFVLILLAYDINRYNKYIKIVNKIYKISKKNDDYNIRIY